MYTSVIIRCEILSEHAVSICGLRVTNFDEYLPSHSTSNLFSFEEIDVIRIPKWHVTLLTFQIGIRDVNLLTD